MSLTIHTVTLPSAKFNGESTLPSLYEMSNVQHLAESHLDEDDELFVGYGGLASIFPYRMQDLYDRADTPTAYIGVTLENAYLKALFLPELGGRLWSLYDKVAGRELLYSNPVVRPCNLAVRNAWLAGGIEFNCGMIGHHPFTCSPIHAVETSLADGTPVLRMYEYERIRGAVYQMDFFLPEDSRVLYGRMRIVNPNRETVPMYWWTNMAVREDPEARDIIDATETYNNKNGMVGKNPVPVYEDIDITYPSNNPIAIDYFWKIPPSSRKYTAYIDRKGYGFMQSSTARLQGRKLFVWGQGEGGKRWQEFLTQDGHDGRYVEIQAGLAHTQYECIPMPPKTAWEWLETFGAVTADPGKVHGDWADARAEVGRRLEEISPIADLEALLAETKPMALSPANTRICYGSAWGTLENLRREKAQLSPICPHLDFGALTEAEQPWATLLKTGCLPVLEPTEAPASWMLQKEWTHLLEKAAPTHENQLHLAAICMAERRVRDAEEALDATLALRVTPTALFLKAQVYRLKDDLLAAAQTALGAHALCPSDVSLARQAFALALRVRLHGDIVTAYEAAPQNVQADGRVAMTYAFALLREGKTDEAEAVLYRDGGLSVTDIREGEISLTSLYISIQKARAEARGETLEDADIDVPRQFDFRMNVPKKK
ncbi:MAG: DUF5107 domain-containing protein [Clostridia bacterium]|nr:DUF5107 domain-containing protein [Clostridia bacterium]